MSDRFHKAFLSGYTKFCHIIIYISVVIKYSLGLLSQPAGGVQTLLVQWLSLLMLGKLLIAERLSARQLIVQCGLKSQLAYIYIYVRNFRHA